MIRNAFCATCLVLLVSLSVMAQDVPKVEVFGGYSWAGGNFHGWNTSVTGNVNNWLGVVADFSGQYGSELDGVIRINQDAHSFLFGPRLSRRGKKFTPFAYALFGATRFHESATISGQKLSAADTGFSSAFGGGLDVNVNDRVAIRAFQIDYFRPNFFGEAHNRGRLAFGVVLRFGKK
jgi:opacity protein-like surface antigen